MLSWMGLSALNLRHFHAVAGSVESASTMAQYMNSMASQPSLPENRARSANVEVRMMRTLISPPLGGIGEFGGDHTPHLQSNRRKGSIEQRQLQRRRNR